MKIKDFTSCLKKNKNILIHGNIGSGKSYLSQQVASQLMFDKSNFKDLSDQERELYNKHVKHVYFNSSSDYQYLIEDLIHENGNNTDSSPKVKDGIIKEFCKNIINSKPDYIDLSKITNKTQSASNLQRFNKYHKIQQQRDSKGRDRFYDYYSAQNLDEERNLINQQESYYDWHTAARNEGLVIPTFNTYDTNYRVFSQNRASITSFVDKFFEEYMNIPISYKHFRGEYVFLTSMNFFGLLGTLNTTSVPSYRYGVYSKQAVIDCLLDKNNYQASDPNLTRDIKAFAYAIENYARHPELQEQFVSNESNFPIIEPSKETVPLKKELPYVLILDDLDNGNINNGFGEILKCVNKRGINNSIKTKYQNYTDKDDIFYNGFYIPDNLYIIGTMNDVKCQDLNNSLTLAQTFASKNINVKDTQDEILATLPTQYKELSLTKLANLNNCLRDIEEFNKLSISNYEIGAGILKEFIELYLENNPNLDSKELFNDLWEYKLKYILSLYLVHNSIPESETKLALLEKAYNKTS